MCRLFPERYRNGFKLTVHAEELDKPYHWRKPRRVFVNTVSDTFHPDVPDEINRRAFGVMRDCGQHDFQILTKRPERMREFARTTEWPRNVWAGTTIENNDYVFRADILRKVPASVRFISYEPALGPLPDLDLAGIDLVIMGGESGPGFRPMDPDWAREMRDRCVSEGVAFFLKQYAGLHPKTLGRELDGVMWDGMPSPRTGN
jgi:protein gp37